MSEREYRDVPPLENVARALAGCDDEVEALKTENAKLRAVAEAAEGHVDVGPDHPYWKALAAWRNDDA